MNEDAQASASSPAVLEPTSVLLRTVHMKELPSAGSSWVSMVEEEDAGHFSDGTHHSNLDGEVDGLSLAMLLLLGKKVVRPTQLGKASSSAILLHPVASKIGLGTAMGKGKAPLFPESVQPPAAAQCPIMEESDNGSWIIVRRWRHPKNKIDPKTVPPVVDPAPMASPPHPVSPILSQNCFRTSPPAGGIFRAG
ncbi:hypothetical protein KSP39_PZI014505 [Platanthera zijinensis]|uniref:Uncharacterized protein n=1 Tax=Platanthera zijinensis TaxID=2320716 RepID=A0AAP0G2K9_9ASPA